MRRLVGQKIVNLESHPSPYTLVDVIGKSCRRNGFWKILHDEVQMLVSLSDGDADMSLGASNIDDGAVGRDVGPRVARSEMVRRLPWVGGEGSHRIGEAFREVGFLA